MLFVSVAVRLPGRWVLVDFPDVDSLRDLQCVAAPMGPHGPDTAQRCPRKVFPSRVWCRLDHGPAGIEVTETAAMPSKYEQRLMSLTCSQHVQIATWVHPAVRVMPTGQPTVIAGEAEPPDIDTLLLALHRGGHRPEPLGDLAWVAACPVEGSMLLIPNDEPPSCAAHCSWADIAVALGLSADR